MVVPCCKQMTQADRHSSQLQPWGYEFNFNNGRDDSEHARSIRTS